MAGSMLRQAASLGDREKVVRLLGGGANPCSRDEDGLTPLHLAAWNSNEDCLDFLVVNDVGRVGTERMSCLETVSDAGWTALHVAGSPSVARKLLLAGVDPKIRDNQGRTALDLARERKELDMADALLYRPSLYDRRLEMTRLEASSKLVHYKRRPPRPLENVNLDDDGCVGSFDPPVPPNNEVPHSDHPESNDDDEEAKAKTVGPLRGGKDAALAFAAKCTTRGPPAPMELTLPEADIKAFAAVDAPRSVKIRNLVFALDEASRNLARRRDLRRFQYDAIENPIERTAASNCDHDDAETFLSGTGLDFFFSIDDVFRPTGLTDRFAQADAKKAWLQRKQKTASVPHKVEDK